MSQTLLLENSHKVAVVGAVGDIHNLLVAAVAAVVEEHRIAVEVYTNMSTNSCEINRKGTIILRVVGLGRVLLWWSSVTSVVSVPRHRCCN
jgi:hypothetical protein